MKKPTLKRFYRVYFSAMDTTTEHCFYEEHEDFSSFSSAYRLLSIMGKPSEDNPAVSFFAQMYLIEVYPSGKLHSKKKMKISFSSLKASHRKRRGGTAPNRALHTEEESTEEDIFFYYPCPSCVKEDCEHCSFLDAEDEYLLFDKTL